MATKNVILKDEEQNTLYPKTIPSMVEGLSGSTVNIVDAGEYFTGTNTEAALQEVGEKLNGLETILGDI